MANTYTQLYTHIVFHTKITGITMRDEDLERVFQYIGGIIREEGAIPFAVGGVEDHIHIFTQAEHHNTKTYREEYGETLKAYGINYDERYAFCD